MDNLKQQVLEAATLYYKDNMTQQSIADKLGITRQTVSKLLKIAVEENIVEIKIHEPQKQTEELEKELTKKLGVTVLVGDTTNGDELLRRKATVREACNYITKCVKDGNKKIGLAWGKTVQEIIKDIEPIKTQNNLVFPLVGATSKDVACYYSNKLVSDFASKIGAEVTYAMFPNYVSDRDCTLIKKTQLFKDISDLWKKADIAVVGIGDITAVNDLRASFDKKAVNADFVGDLVTHVFDKNGNVLKTKQDSLCVPFIDVKNIKNTIAVACGTPKVEPIISACKTGAVNVLITDAYTAKEILEKF